MITSPASLLALIPFLCCVWAAPLPFEDPNAVQRPAVMPPRGPNAFWPRPSLDWSATPPGLQPPGHAGDAAEHIDGGGPALLSQPQGSPPPPPPPAHAQRPPQPVKDYKLGDTIDYRAEEEGTARSSTEQAGLALKPARWYVYWRNGYVEMPRPREWHMPSPPARTAAEETQ